MSIYLCFSDFDYLHDRQVRRGMSIAPAISTTGPHVAWTNPYCQHADPTVR